MQCPVCKGKETIIDNTNPDYVICTGCGVVLYQEILLLKEEEDNG
jgi:transcription initiation factor TFIIIB Brf1 subunit/transcription initiation factor TFIIB